MPDSGGHLMLTARPLSVCVTDDASGRPGACSIPQRHVSPDPDSDSADRTGEFRYSRLFISIMSHLTLTLQGVPKLMFPWRGYILTLFSF